MWLDTIPKHCTNQEPKLAKGTLAKPDQFQPNLSKHSRYELVATYDCSKYPHPSGVGFWISLHFLDIIFHLGKWSCFHSNPHYHRVINHSNFQNLSMSIKHGKLNMPITCLSIVVRLGKWSMADAPPFKKVCSDRRVWCLPWVHLTHDEWSPYQAIVDMQSLKPLRIYSQSCHPTIPLQISSNYPSSKKFECCGK